MHKKNESKKAPIVITGVIIEVAWLVFGVYKLEQFKAIGIMTYIIALILVFRVYGKHTNYAFKMLWMFILLAAPPAGIVLYLLYGSKFSSIFVRRRFKSVYGLFEAIMPDDDDLLEKMKIDDVRAYGQAYYLSNSAHYRPFSSDKVEFFPEAYLALERMKEELIKAKKFIFMEYHTIENGEAFDEIEEILIQKAKQGVDVRIIYDDVGSLSIINKPFKKKLKRDGIKTRVFNPIFPIMSVFMNNRDHRKMTIIDGKVGFVGGYNISDEYFNITNPFGYWKDAGIVFRGKPVDTLTLIFLEMWHAMKKGKKDQEDIRDLLNQEDLEILDKTIETIESDEKAKPCVKVEEKCLSIIQPFADNPLTEENVSVNVYLNMIKKANEYLYITTPYLIIDDHLRDELAAAAKRGVDVRIIVPGVPDKKFVNRVSKSYYKSLVKSGVKIYEFVPGFIHCKIFISDHKYAVIGTINLDYRSLYLHFENGVFMYNTNVINKMKEDYEDTLKKSEEVTSRYFTDKNFLTRVWHGMLRFISPLL